MFQEKVKKYNMLNLRPRKYLIYILLESNHEIHNIKELKKFES